LGEVSFRPGAGEYLGSEWSQMADLCAHSGRRYHAYRDGLYAFPNDEIEQGRDDTKHDMTMLLTDRKLFFAPIADRLQAGGATVLDMGTGTGQWALARTFLPIFLLSFSCSPDVPFHHDDSFS
jgi:hypothetical protein